MCKIVNIGVIVGSMLTFAHATNLSAQKRTIAVSDTLADNGRELEEVQITSSKAQLALLQTAKTVTVITRTEIERQPAQSVADLLKNIVGVDVRQRGGNGVQSDISVRGGTFDQTAILLNGANLTSPHTGHYSLDLPVNLSDIECIEIIQGPASLLYGSGAFAGGINIITKKKSGTGIYLKAEGGMYKLWGTEARGSFQTASSSHSLSAGYNSSAGYTYNSDYKIFNAFWQSHFQEENANLDIQLGINDKKYGANTFYSPSYRDQFDDTQTLFASVKGEAGTALKFIPQMYWMRHYDCFQLYRDGTPNIPDWYKGHNYHYSDVFGFNPNLQYKWKYGITSMGGEIRNEGIFSNKLGKDTVKLGKYTLSDSRTNISYFVEHTYFYQGFTLGIGFLANYNRSFSGKMDFYPTLNAAYWLTNRWKIFISWNNAVRMPTFTDLYYIAPDLNGFAQLQPEKSESYEAGVLYNHPFITLAFNGFYEKGKNIIDWVRKPDETLVHATNLTSVNKAGFETYVTVLPGKFLPQLSASRLKLGYTYLHQTRNTGDWISNYVMDYLRHKFIVNLSHPICKRLSADWQFRWQDRAGTYSRLLGKDAEGNSIFSETPYPTFALLDLKLNWKKERLSIFLTANNIFNVSYYDRGNIPQAGFWLTGGMAYSIQ
jgi:iron complex outermembrane receptor protein